MTTTNEDVLSRNSAAARALADGILPLRDGVRALQLAGAGLAHAGEGHGADGDALIWAADRIEAALDAIGHADEGMLTVLHDGVRAARLTAAGLVPSGSGSEATADALLWLIQHIEDDAARFSESMRGFAAEVMCHE
jgi:hypothetical protein